LFATKFSSSVLSQTADLEDLRRFANGSGSAFSVVVPFDDDSCDSCAFLTASGVFLIEIRDCADDMAALTVAP
jgi:hypothetical protein